MMTETESMTRPRPSGWPPDEAPRPFVVMVAVVVALWCLGFAAISVWFEVTDHFATGQYARDVSAISVMNWFVAVLKVVGCCVALLAGCRRLVVHRVVGVVLWAAFATLTVYVVGSIAEAVAMLTGVAGDTNQIDATSVGYVMAFLLGAAGFGVLAITHARRARLDTRYKVIGACGAPIVLGTVLVVLPALLRAVGLLSAG
jgi:hypothetical protein